MKNVHFSGKGRQSLIQCIYAMRISKMLISYVKLDHTLYSINYGNNYRFHIISISIVFIIITSKHQCTCSHQCNILAAADLVVEVMAELSYLIKEGSRLHRSRRYLLTQ